MNIKPRIVKQGAWWICGFRLKDGWSGRKFWSFDAWSGKTPAEAFEGWQQARASGRP